MTTTLPMTDREKLATLADHGYAVAKLNSGCGPVDGAWTLTDPDGDHLQIGGQGGVSTTRGAAIDEGMRRIAAEATTTTDPMADQTTWTNMSSAGTFAAVAIGDRFKFAAYGASYVKLDRWRYQLVRHEDGSPVPGMTYNVRERGTDTAVAP